MSSDVCCVLGSLDLLKFMLERDYLSVAERNFVSGVNGASLLHLAANAVVRTSSQLPCAKFEEAVTILLEAGVDPNIKDKHGQQAVDMLPKSSPHLAAYQRIVKNSVKKKRMVEDASKPAAGEAATKTAASSSPSNKKGAAHASADGAAESAATERSSSTSKTAMGGVAASGCGEPVTSHSGKSATAAGGKKANAAAPGISEKGSRVEQHNVVEDLFDFFLVILA